MKGTEETSMRQPRFKKESAFGLLKGKISTEDLDELEQEELSNEVNKESENNQKTD